ncbi:MAG: carboxypeptidase regulatory-like domain-containing protein [Candidatus Thermoplasmatota archaeon]|jgi:hypothetical protein
MRPFALFAATSLLAVLLAGCSSGGDNPSATTSTTGPLKSGKGAISGLLINDVFRPVPGGLILIQELGLTATSDSSGQFSFLDLEPGSYMLRVQADGHEAAPQTVDVKEGEYTETELVARRVFNEGGRIITNEYSIFMTCTMEAVVVSGNGLNCLMDQSGESERTSFESDLRGIAGITYLVTEIRFNKVDDYDFVLAVDDDGDGVLDRYWAEATVDNGDYARIVLENGTANTEHDVGRNIAWKPDVDVLHTTVFPHGELYTELSENAGTYGAGVDFGVRGKIVETVFIGEPEVDIASYCVLC